jgi:polyisoprenyl-phosphate glycosyltransferase
MAERWLAGSPFVICERTARDDPIGTRMSSALYYALLRTLVMPEYPRGGYDLALMDERFLPFMRDASKASYTLLLAYWLGFQPEVIRYHRERRTHGISRWTLRKKIGLFLDVMLGFSVRPLRLMAGVGIVVAFLSFLYGMVIITSAITGAIEVPGWASIVALITFLLGFVIIMLGLLGEYLARILDELNRRPEVVIDKVL